MAQTSKVGRVATSIQTREGYTRVVYHSTEVVKFNPEYIVLDAGGWHSATTKARMNQTANQFELGYSVFQKNHKWFVSFNEKEYPFESGMLMNRMTGKVWAWSDEGHRPPAEIQPVEAK